MNEVLACYCSQCGTPNICQCDCHNEGLFCNKCGLKNPVYPNAIAYDGSNVSPGSNVSQSNTSPCAKCGKMNEVHAGFCSQCGTPSIFCKCASHNEGLFCNKCGRKNPVYPNAFAYEGSKCKCGKANPASASFCSNCGERSGSASQGNTNHPWTPHSFAFQPVSAHEDTVTEIKNPKAGSGTHYPFYDWCEWKRGIVSRENPMFSASDPPGFCPNPALNHWKPAKRGVLHEMEVYRVHQMQEIQGLLYGAIAAQEVCSWPENGVMVQGEGTETPWGKLGCFQKALACVESQLTFAACKELEFDASTTRNHLGLSTCPIPLRVQKDLAKQEATKKKIKDSQRPKEQHYQQGGYKGEKGGKRQQNRENDKGGRKRTDGVCYVCQEAGHMSYQCPKRKQDVKKADALATEARIQQMEAARHRKGEAVPDKL